MERAIRTGSVGGEMMGGASRKDGTLYGPEAWMELPALETPMFDSSGGACQGEDPGMFTREYAYSTRESAIEANTDAIKICRGCPIRKQCLEWAMCHDERGLWGGVMEGERREALVAGITAEALIHRDRKRAEAKVKTPARPWVPSYLRA